MFTLKSCSAYLLMSPSKAPLRPPCGSAAALRRLLPRAPLAASIPRFTKPAGALLPASAAQKDVGPERGVSQSSQRSRWSGLPAKVQTEHVHTFAVRRALLLLRSLRVAERIIPAAQNQVLCLLINDCERAVRFQLDKEPATACACQKGIKSGVPN